MALFFACFFFGVIVGIVESAKNASSMSDRIKSLIFRGEQMCIHVTTNSFINVD